MARLGQAVRVAAADDLPDAGPQRLGQGADVEPVPDQHHAEPRPVPALPGGERERLAEAVHHGGVGPDGGDDARRLAIGG